MFKKCESRALIISVIRCFLTVTFCGFSAVLANEEIDENTFNSYLAKHCSDEQVQFMAHGAGSWPGRQYSGRHVVISEQSGNTDLERLQSAISLALPGDTLVGAPHLKVDIKGMPVMMPSAIALKGNRMRITSSVATKYLLGAKENTAHYYISGVIFDGAGNDSYASVVMRGVEFVVIENSVFINTGKSAITIESSDTRGAKFVKVVNNYMHSPAKGIAHTVFIKSRFDGEFVSCVSVMDNVAYGTDPNSPNLADYTAENEFSADQITLHGVKGFILSGNFSSWSGSSGFTVSRMSGDGVISNNVAEMCYEPGFNIGSGYEAVYVDDIRDFRVGDLIKGSERATLDIKAILPSNSKTKKGGWLRGNARHDWLTVGDRVQAVGSKFSGASILSVERSTQNILITNNVAIDTGIQGNKKGHLGAFNTIRSDKLWFRENRYSNVSGEMRVDKLISLSLSRAVLTDNHPSYKKTPSAYQIAGPKSEILQD